VVARLHRDVHPVLEVVRPVLGVDRANLSLVQERQRASYGRDLYGLKDAIQNQDMTVEHMCLLTSPNTLRLERVSQCMRFELAGP